MESDTESKGHLLDYSKKGDIFYILTILYFMNN